jgi:lysophospholipase L1-like esterase
LLKDGGLPYWKEQAFTDAKNFKPDVVIILLGTNDAKSQNMKFKNEFVADYTALINEFKALSSKPFIFICLPVPAYPAGWGINDIIIRVDIIPMIISVGTKNKVPIINLYNTFSNHEEWFPDKIHPNAAGAEKIAIEISKVLIKNKKNIEKRKK